MMSYVEIHCCLGCKGPRASSNFRTSLPPCGGRSGGRGPGCPGMCVICVFSSPLFLTPLHCTLAVFSALSLELYVHGVLG